MTAVGYSSETGVGDPVDIMPLKGVQAFPVFHKETSPFDTVVVAPPVSW